MKRSRHKRMVRRMRKERQPCTCCKKPTIDRWRGRPYCSRCNPSVRFPEQYPAEPAPRALTR